MSPSSGRWSGTASRQSRHLAILSAAGRIFTEVGYDRASMDLIATRTGVTKATLYAHFHSKAHLFGAVMERWLEALPAPAFLVDPAACVREQLTTVAGDLVRLATHPAAVAIATALAQSPRMHSIEHLHAWQQRYCPHQRHLEKVLSRHCGCDAPALAARQFLLLVIGNLDPSTACSEPDGQMRALAAVDVFMRAFLDRDPR
jgi:AcrR family transcriptional regulator